MRNSPGATPHWPVGISPILWNNDDLPELTQPVPWERVLDDVVSTGYDGVELGSNAPREAKAVREQMEQRGLRLAGAFVAFDLLDGTPEEAAAEATAKARFLKLSGAEVLVVGPAFRPDRAATVGRTEGNASDLTDDDWRRVAACLERIGEACQREGIQPALHNHAGTIVETPWELAEVFSRTDPALVKLCLDVGHYLVGGGDPVEAVRDYGNRTVHVHLKDVDQQVLDRLRHGEGGWVEGLRWRVFCELGQGCLDVAGVVEGLRRESYSGWVLLEQDTTFLPPLESAVESRAAFRRIAGY